MLSAYMCRLSLGYLVNLIARFSHRSVEGKELLRWVVKTADFLALPGYAGNPRRCADVPPCLDKAVSQEDLPEAEWDRLREALAAAHMASKRIWADRTGQRIRRLSAFLQPSPSDVALLELLLHYETQPIIESLVDEIPCSNAFSRHRCRFFSVTNPGVAHVLGISMGTLPRCLKSDSPLVESGLVSVDGDGEFNLLHRLARLAHLPARAGRDVQQLLFDEAPAAELEWRDFDHVARGRDHVERLIAGALETGERGVNVLVYGAPGTGKTQFCGTLARRLGITMYSVGEAGQGGREPSRAERLQELRSAQRVLGGCRNSVLLFDEMEDLLSDPGSMFLRLMGIPVPSRRRADGSKVFMNRLLEQTEVPTMWATNSAGQTCATILRRMMYALALRQPSPRVRTRIWARQLKRQGIASVESDAQALARDFNVTPGGRTFEPDPEFDLRAFAERSFGAYQEPPLDIVLWFTPEAARDAATFLFHPTQKRVKNDDGPLTVRFTAGGQEEMCRHLFTWGTGVAVEAPTRLRDRLQRMCADLANHHAVQPEINENRGTQSK